MIKNKKILVLATAGVVALGYAAVSTNAFADTTVPPTAVVTVPAAPIAPALPTGISVSSGTSASAGLQNSPLSSMPSIGDDDGDDSSNSASISGDDDGDDSSSLGVAVTTSDENYGNVAQGEDHEDSDSND